MKVVFIADLKDIGFASKPGATVFSKGLSQTLGQLVTESVELGLALPGVLRKRHGESAGTIKYGTQTLFIQSDREDEVLKKLETVLAGESAIHTAEGGDVSRIADDDTEEV